jgi:uncharacterized protein
MANTKRLQKLPEKASFFLFGPRQTGKSTLIRSCFPKNCTKFYDLLDSKEYTRLVAAPYLLREEVLSLNEKITHIVIDEVQRIPSLLDEVHYMIESLSLKKFFILSGSSARKLKRGGANMLGGRAWTRHLYPLSYQELKQNFNLSLALSYGTLPSVYGKDREYAIETLDSYVETYLEEEIKAEALVRNIGAFVKFLSLAASESGSIINYTNISRETNTSAASIKEYYKILEDTLIGSFILPYSKSSRKRLSKHPKFYLFDTGVLLALRKRTCAKLESSTKEYGELFEHFIINEIIRLNKYHKKKFELLYYRTSSGAEVDLIIIDPLGKIFAIEIKASENPRDYKSGLKSFQELEPEARLICLSNCPNYRKDADIDVYPWKEGLEILFRE